MTNAFYQSAEPKFTCNKCGETKDIGLFVTSTRTLVGYRPLCKACKSIQNAAHRAKMAALAVQQVQETRATRAADKNIALPRTYVSSGKDWTPPAEGYVRNDGNKNIPSKGM